MIIPITISASSSSSSISAANPKLPPGLVKISNDEIVLIELQGSLEVEPSDPIERNGKLVGKLKIDEITNKPTLLIGHHLLEGKIGALPKPYAILVRQSRSITTGGGGRRRSKRSKSKKGPTDNSSIAPGQKKSEKEAAADSDRMDVDSEEEEEEEDVDHDHDEQEDEQTEEEIGGPGSHSPGARTETSAGWTIAGIVKKKIIFSKRPMPVTVRK